MNTSKLFAKNFITNLNVNLINVEHPNYFGTVSGNFETINFLLPFEIDLSNGANLNDTIDCMLAEHFEVYGVYGVENGKSDK